MLSEVDPIRHVLVKRPRDAFRDDATIAAQWQPLNFAAPPDLRRAETEHDRFTDILRAAGAIVHLLPKDDATTLDSIYARDAAVLVPGGIVLCAMGKPQRASEPDAQERAFAALDVPFTRIAGRIEPPGCLEGGDVVWFDSRTVAVGRGYRTNADGIRQLRQLAGPDVELIEVPLPHWRGERDVMHLMSLVSPVAQDLAVVYSPLLPVPFRQWLLARGVRLVEVPDEEFDSMGANVLAMSPRACVMISGNPRTRTALEAAGVVVQEYEGQEISVKGAGGPTCLTRPLERG